ncbi:MAG: hypothetical protein HKO87_07320, partial [Acidimicrobiia bacterium]|nr:hypothetical protein [Acidimicrobiia bacterium]
MVDETEHGEIRHRFEDSLDAIRQGLVQMGSLVTENTRRAGSVLLESDLALAETVFEADGEIDEMYSALEHESFSTMARQQPVAGDLRFLVAAT